MDSVIKPNPLTAIEAENARLIALLETNGIDWQLPAANVSPLAEPEPSVSTAEKIAIFRKLFRGRTDVYPIRWESKMSSTHKLLHLKVPVNISVLFFSV
jgi:hypothetical protein